MNSLEATPVTLTSEERAELEGLARSTKTEHRTRRKARIVLMAAEGAATRAIGRALAAPLEPHRSGGCATQRIVWPASPRPAIAGLKPNTARRQAGAFWRCSISRRRRAALTGPGL